MTGAVSSLMGTLRCVIRQPSYGPPGGRACSVGLALPGTPTKTTTCHVSKVTAPLGGDVPSVLEMLKRALAHAVPVSVHGRGWIIGNVVLRGLG